MRDCAWREGSSTPRRAGSARHHRRGDKSPTNQPLQQVPTAEDATRHSKRQHPHRHRTVRRCLFRVDPFSTGFCLVQLITHPSSLIVQEKERDLACYQQTANPPLSESRYQQTHSRPPVTSSSTRLHGMTKFIAWSYAFDLS